MIHWSASEPRREWFHYATWLSSRSTTALNSIYKLEPFSLWCAHHRTHLGLQPRNRFGTSRHYVLYEPGSRNRMEELRLTSPGLWPSVHQDCSTSLVVVLDLPQGTRLWVRMTGKGSRRSRRSIGRRARLPGNLRTSGCGQRGEVVWQ